MRLWSISPVYLDSKGLVALWRESLLAQAVIGEHTRGYKNHPQLDRFYNSHYPMLAIGHYLTYIFEVACERGYKFDSSKIVHFHAADPNIIAIGADQIRYEFSWLQHKLATRDKEQWLRNFRLFETDQEVHTHPSFYKVTGPVESWETVKECVLV